MKGAAAQAADSSYAQLQGADLSYAQLQGADLIKAQLQSAHLRSAELQFADLRAANLQGADLRNAKLQGAKIFGYKLQGANLENAELQGANFRWAKLQGKNLRFVQLQGADFDNAQLQGADLQSAQLQGANLMSAQLQGADLDNAQLQGADFRSAKLQGAKLPRAQLQGALLVNFGLAGAQFTKTRLDYALILNPIVDWTEQDENQLSNLKSDSLSKLNKASEKRLLSAIKRFENAKGKSFPNMSEAILEKQDNHCLLLTNNQEFQNSTKHVCDSVSDPSIDPLIHLRKWAKYNARVSCNHKRFVKHPIKSDDIDSNYKIVKNYRTLDNKATTPNETSEALINLAFFLFNKELIQIHQDKTKQCESRKELGYWYAWYKDRYENDTEKKNQILDLKLEPFPTSAKH